MNIQPIEIRGSRVRYSIFLFTGSRRSHFASAYEACIVGRTPCKLYKFRPHRLCGPRVREPTRNLLVPRTLGPRFGKNATPSAGLAHVLLLSLFQTSLAAPR